MSAVPVDDLSRARAASAMPTFDRKMAVTMAKKRLASSLKGREAPTYPAAALGPLAGVCDAVAVEGQLQPAMAGQTLLAAASLLTQGLFNVETLSGRKPLSLDLLTLADSGEGKSTAQAIATHAVTEWQRIQAKQYREDVEEFYAAKAKRKKGDDLPAMPVCPFRLVGDATIEGLRRDLDGGVCSQGLFSDEAAAILCGYGMSVDHKAKTGAALASLWDSGRLSVSRATGGRVERYGRRLAVHMLIQPAAAAEAVSDQLLTQLGFWPRFLAAWPAPQEPRTARPLVPERSSPIVEYWARCSELLGEALPEDAGDAPVLSLSLEARAMLGKSFEQFEREARRGSLQSVKPFALRASEQACRVAGVLSAFEGKTVVTEASMRGALALVAYSLRTWQAIADDGAAFPHGAAALRLYEWLTDRPNWCESLAVIVNAGPSCVRSKDRRDVALATLESVDLVSVANGKAYALPVESLEGGST